MLVAGVLPLLLPLTATSVRERMGLVTGIDFSGPTWARPVMCKARAGARARAFSVGRRQGLRTVHEGRRVMVVVVVLLLLPKTRFAYRCVRVYVYV